MFWPFKRKPKSTPPEVAATPEEDVYDRAARNLIAQGVPPHKVERAARLIKRYAKDGVLPEGLVKPEE